MSTPTQVRHPRRTTLRSLVQVTIPAIIMGGLVVPEIVSIVLEEAGESMPAGIRVVLLGASAVVVAVSATLTRIMAIPQVEYFLRRSKLLNRLAAAPPS